MSALKRLLLGYTFILFALVAAYLKDDNGFFTGITIATIWIASIKEK